MATGFSCSFDVYEPGKLGYCEGVQGFENGSPVVVVKVPACATTTSNQQAITLTHVGFKVSY